MIIAGQNEEVISNAKTEKRFTIAATAKAFKVLSSSLYSRKIEAIIRELSCNAVDSHKMAGYPERPFHVQLPNEWESEFAVEDFGIGLDDDGVNNIYTSYFTSTKTESNDFIGGLGLGSKTPFSYTDAFNIRARKDGVERCYNAFISSSGEPSVSLLTECETAELNGVRVSVPVKQGDYNAFYEDAKKVLSWFTVVPEIIGINLNIDNDKATRLEKEGFYWSTYNKTGYARDRITAVMGNVAYVINGVTASFKSDFTSGELTFFSHNELYVKFNIGDLDVAASRETISFDEDTKAVFIQKIKDTIHCHNKGLQDDIDNHAESIPDAINMVETEVGAWAFDMFTFKGASIFKLAQASSINILRNIIEHKSADGQTRLNQFFYKKTTGYYGGVRREELYYADGNVAFSTVFGKVVHIIIGDQANIQSVARRYTDEQVGAKLHGVYIVDNMLNDIQIKGLHEEFGSQRVVIVQAADLIEARKAELKAARDEAERARKAEIADALARGVAIPEAKVRRERKAKTQVRVATASIKVGVDGKESVEYDADACIDTSFVDNCKYTVLQTLRNACMDDDLGDIRFNRKADCYLFMKMLGITKLIITKRENHVKVEELFGLGVSYKDHFAHPSNWTFIFDIYIASKVPSMTSWISMNQNVSNKTVSKIIKEMMMKNKTISQFEEVFKRIKTYHEASHLFDMIPWNLRYKCEKTCAYLKEKLDIIPSTVKTTLYEKYPMLNLAAYTTSPETVTDYIQAMDLFIASHTQKMLDKQMADDLQLAYVA